MGLNVYGQTNVPAALTNVVAIAAGAEQSLALKQSGIAVFVNETHIRSPPAIARGSAQIKLLNPFIDGTILYTLNGSDPSVSGLLYDAPFKVSQNATLRAIAYNLDFSQSTPLNPLALAILPTVTALTDGGGNVTVDPPAGPYLSNSLAIVTATPDPGWSFLQWLGDVVGTNPVAQLVATRDRNLRAVFGTSLSTRAVGSGGIQANPTAALYPFGTKVRLTAVPNPGSYFVSWGNAASGTNNPLDFTVTTANSTITALFASLGEQDLHAFTVIANGNGEVGAMPPGNYFPSNTKIVLSATPEPGQEFLGWSGDATGGDNPLSVTVDQSKIISANFSKRPRLVLPTWFEPVDPEGCRFLLTGGYGERFTVEASTNLRDWTPLAVLTNHFGTMQFKDESSAQMP